MPEIKSPLGNRSFPSNAPVKKTYSVPDESNSMFDIPGEEPSVQQPQVQSISPTQFNEMQARKQQARSVQQRPTSESRQRIELLTGIGRMETSLILDDHKFTMQSLKSREMRDVVKEAAKIELLSDQMFELRIQTLARAIISIDDHPINLVLGTDAIEMKLNFIDECEEHVVEQLYNSYSEMINKNKNKFTIKDEIEAKEVVSEIKK